MEKEVVLMGRASRNGEEYPHTPAAFINAIAEEGTKAEAIEYLQKTWNELCHVRRELATIYMKRVSARSESAPKVTGHDPVPHAYHGGSGGVCESCFQPPEHSNHTPFSASAPIREHITDLRSLAEEMALTAEGVPGMNLTLSKARIARICRAYLALSSTERGKCSKCGMGPLRESCAYPEACEHPCKELALKLNQALLSARQAIDPQSMVDFLQEMYELLEGTKAKAETLDDAITEVRELQDEWRSRAAMGAADRRAEKP